MEYKQAYAIAESTAELLRPHCYRIEIAGSIRRGKKEVKDIEIVAIPKPYEIGLLESGIAEVVNRWPKIKGPLKYGKTKYTQRILPEGIVLDLFFADKTNWGLIFALRTGGADFNKKILLKALEKQGCRSIDGRLIKNGVAQVVEEEMDLFSFAGIPFKHPSQRKVD